MSTFCGVISSKPVRLEHLAAEFVDLEIVADQLINETENLFLEFQRKLKCVCEQDIRLLDNEKKVEVLDLLINLILAEMTKIEIESQNVCCQLCEIENAVSQLEKCTIELPRCRCQPISEYHTVLDLLIATDSALRCIDYEVQQISDCRNTISMQLNPFDLKLKLFQFLDCYEKILRQTERNVYEAQTKSNLINDILCTYNINLQV